MLRILALLVIEVFAAIAVLAQEPPRRIGSIDFADLVPSLRYVTNWKERNFDPGSLSFVLEQSTKIKVQKEYA